MFKANATIAIIALILVLARTSSAQTGKMNLDLVFVVHHQIQSYLKNEGDRDRVKDTLKNDIGKTFNIGEDMTRVAFVANVDGDDQKQGHWEVIANLTGDFDAFKKKVDQLAKMRVDAELGEAFKMIRQSVFSGPATRPRVVLVITIHKKDPPMWPYDYALSEKGYGEGRELMKDGTIISVAVEAISHPDDPYYKDFRKLTGVDNLVYEFCCCSPCDNNKPGGKIQYNFDEHFLNKFSADVHPQICLHEPICAFDDKRRCLKDWYTPQLRSTMMTHAGKTCSEIHVNPPFRLAPEYCEAGRCDAACNELWPLVGKLPDCSSSCGKEFKIERVGPAPWAQLQHCPTMYRCPPCPEKPLATEAPLNILPNKEYADKEITKIVVAVVVPIVLLIIIVGVGTALYARSKKGKMAKQGGKKAKDVESGKKTSKASKTKKTLSKSKKKSSSIMGAVDESVETGTKKKKGASKSVDASIASEAEKRKGKSKSKAKSPKKPKAADVACKIPTKKGKKTPKKK